MKKVYTVVLKNHKHTFGQQIKNGRIILRCISDSYGSQVRPEAGSY